MRRRQIASILMATLEERTDPPPFAEFRNWKLDWVGWWPIHRRPNVLGVSCGGLHVQGTARRDGRRD